MSISARLGDRDARYIFLFIPIILICFKMLLEAHLTNMHHMQQSESNRYNLLTINWILTDCTLLQQPVSYFKEQI